MNEILMNNWFEITGLFLLCFIIFSLKQNHDLLFAIREHLRQIAANTDRRKSDRRKVVMSVAKDKRIANRRDAEIHRLHELYHEGDIPIASSSAEKELNSSKEK